MRHGHSDDTSHGGQGDSGRGHDGDGARHGGHHRHHHRGRHGARPFDYGDLRLLVMAMIAEQPRHGYELMKSIEERMGGSYTPSPGVIYPTLSWLEDMGYAVVEASAPGRKQYRITPEGEAFLAANKSAVEALLARLDMAAAGGSESAPAPIVRSMENLKVALRLRMRRPLDQMAAGAIAAALDGAAQAVEQS